MRTRGRWIVLMLPALFVTPGSAAAQRGQTTLQQAIDIARSARTAGEPASTAASQIASSLRAPAADAIVALLTAGYAAVESTRWHREQLVGITDVTTGLRRSGLSCDAVAATLRDAGFAAHDVRGAIAGEFGTIPGQPAADPGAPEIASLSIDDGSGMTQSRAVTLAWATQGCAPLAVRFSESIGFAGASWQTVSAAASASGSYSGTAAYTFQQDVPGQKTIYVQARNEAGESLPGSATIEYRKLITITDVRLNQGASETNNRAVKVDIAWDGAAPTHIRIAEQNITTQPWLALSQFTTFNPVQSIAGTNYGLTQTFVIESPGFGPKTVWVQLKHNDDNTVSDPISAQIAYGVRPRLHDIEPKVFQNRMVYNVDVYVTGLNNDVATIMDVKTHAGQTPRCAIYEYTNPGGAMTDDEWRQSLAGNFPLNVATAYQVTPIDDETFRLRFSGLFNLQLADVSACQVSVSGKLRGHDGTDLGNMQAFEPPLIVQISHPQPREDIVVENTWDLREYIDVHGGDILTSNSFGLCDGTLTGPAGTFDVGVLNDGGDIAFVTRSAPSGTTCDRQIGASRLRPGWGITLEFEEQSSGDACIVSRDGTPLDGRPTKYAFNRMKEFIGWQTVGNVFGTLMPLPGGAYQWRTPTLFTTCKPTISNDQEVRSIIRRAVITVPQDAPQNPTLHDAFSG